MPQAPRNADEIDAALRVARLHAGLAVNAIVENDDREIGRPLDADGRERAKPHQHFAVARDHRDAPSGLRQREAQTDHGGAAHRAPQIEIAVIVAGGGRIPGGRAEAGNDQQVIAAVGEQRGHGGAAFEPHLVHTFLPISCCDRITAAMRSSPKACWMARSAMPATSSGIVHAINFRLAQFEHRIDDRSHRHLPGIELLPLAAHRDEHQQRKTAGPRQREHVDAIAEAARLHQQRGALAAEPGARGQRDALLFRGEHDVTDFIVGAASVDQARMAGIGHIADLPNAAALERFEQPVRPIIGLAHSFLARLAFGRPFAVLVFIIFRRNGIDAGEPAIEIDIRATLGAEWLEFRLDRLAADRAGTRARQSCGRSHSSDVGFPVTKQSRAASHRVEPAEANRIALAAQQRHDFVKRQADDIGV